MRQDHTIENLDKSKVALYDRGGRVKGSLRVGYLDGTLCEKEPPKRKIKSGRGLLGGNQKCVVDNCLSTCNSPGVKLFRFPGKDLNQRYLWVSLVNKRSDDEEPWTAKPWHRICSRHFAGGAHSSTPSDVNYIPTLFEDALEEGDTFRCAQGEPEQPGAPTSSRATPVEPDTNLPEPEHEIPDVPGEVPEQEHLSVSRTSVSRMFIKGKFDAYVL